MIYVFLDTNILLNKPNIIHDFIDRKINIVIPVTIFDELDNHKKRDDLGYAARSTGRVIESIIANTNYLHLTNDYKQDPHLNLKKADDRILSSAVAFFEQGKLVVLISNDRFLRLKAEAFKINVFSSLNNFYNSQIYIKSLDLNSTKNLQQATRDNDNKGEEKITNRRAKSNNFLSLEEKRMILNSFHELAEKKDNQNRYHYYFLNSKTGRKNIAREFIASGNGYIYGENLPQYQKLTDPRGWVNVKYFTKEELIELVTKAIEAHK
ncbi:MAG: hypothetical protein VR72_08540 [Clostridiaceae bacterium BRH_c20a]|nr:MAG: hypothetical protein VR72_08540 [Clostridiaceae bacterium BRH_c20a]